MINLLKEINRVISITGVKISFLSPYRRTKKKKKVKVGIIDWQGGPPSSDPALKLFPTTVSVPLSDQTCLIVLRKTLLPLSLCYNTS